MADVKVLTKEEIMGFVDIEPVAVVVPEWGDATVYMKTMTAGDRDAWEADVYVSRKKNEYEGMLGFRAKLVAKCLCDKEGKLLFEPKEVKQLSKKSAKAIDRLFEAAQGLNGMRKEDIEKMTENLPEGQADV